MTEKALERKLKKEVKKLGGLCLKCVTPGFTGMPDRKCLLPGGIEWFVEVKGETGIVSDRQKIVIPQLQALGFPANLIWNMEDLENTIERMKIRLGYDL